MFSNSWKRCFPAVFGLFLCGLAGSLHAQNAPFPVGNWGGHPYGVDNYPVYLSVYASGTCTYREPNSGVALIGRCTWNPTASNGGILTLHYDTPTVTQTFHNKLYLGITWINRNSIAMRAGSGPHEGGILNRL
jgi:hypothetical protein